MDNFFNNDVIMSSLVTNPNSTTTQETVNWVTTADVCVHSSHRRRDSTRQVSRVSVGTVYWTPCITTTLDDMSAIVSRV